MKKIAIIFFCLFLTSYFYGQAIVKEFLTYPLGADKEQIEEILNEKKISYFCGEKSIVAECKYNNYRDFPIKSITFIFSEEKLEKMIVRLEDEDKNNLSPKKFESNIINATDYNYELFTVYKNKFTEMDSIESCPSMKWCYSDIIGTIFEYTAYYKNFLEYEISIRPKNCNNTKYNVIDGFENLKFFMTQEECDQVMQDYSWKREKNKNKTDYISYKPKKKNQTFNNIFLTKINVYFDEEGLNEIIIYGTYGLYDYYKDLREGYQLINKIPSEGEFFEDGSVYLKYIEGYYNFTYGSDDRLFIGRAKREN